MHAVILMFVDHLRQVFPNMRFIKSPRSEIVTIEVEVKFTEIEL